MSSPVGLTALNVLGYLFKLGHAISKWNPFAMLNLQVPYGRDILSFGREDQNVLNG